MNLVNLFVYSLFGVSFAVSDVGDECKLHDESEGICNLITNCPVAINEVMTKKHHTLKRCGFKGITEIVCCPHQPSDKFGEKERKKGIAERECEKIVRNSLPPLSLHIIGGEAASLGEFPHMVALGYESSDGYEFQCGGSLLSDTFVLTAAHCVETLGRNPPTIVRMGVVELGNSSRDNETDVDIAQIITHPNYTRRQKYDDLALIRLTRPVELSSTLNAICLYTSFKDPTIPLTVTGWGKTSNIKNVRSNTLLKANVTIVPRENCKEHYMSMRKLTKSITEDQLCAGDPEGLKDSCQGDSGGPLQGLTAQDGHYRLVGVTSFGRGCGSVVPGVYTRINRYIDWIEKVVWPQTSP